MRQEVVFIMSFIYCTITFAADTVLQLYRPFTETNKQVLFHVDKQYTGICSGPSKLAVREDAWRCFVDEKIYDPCFINPNSNKNEAICPQTPWAGKGILLKIDSLPQLILPSLDMSREFPWAVELDTGEKCQAIEPEKSVDNLEIHYQCNPDVFLVGHVQRCENEWKMLKLSDKKISTAVITKAWF